MFSRNQQSTSFLLMLLAAMHSSSSSSAFLFQPQLISKSLKGRILKHQSKPPLFMSSLSASSSVAAEYTNTDNDNDNHNDNHNDNDKYSDNMGPDEDDLDNQDQVDNSYSTSTSGNASAGFDSIQNGLGDWEEMHGNYVLRPPASDQEPRCVHPRYCIMRHDMYHETDILQYAS